MKVLNTHPNLQMLLQQIYVAVLGHVPDDGNDEPIERVPAEKWDALCTTVLDAAEGREFEPLQLPWPA